MRCVYVLRDVSSLVRAQAALTWLEAGAQQPPPKHIHLKIVGLELRHSPPVGLIPVSKFDKLPRLETYDEYFNDRCRTG